MTNHIEELMKVVGVDSEAISEQILTDYGVEEVGVKYVYPAFTPARQLELIKLLLKADNVDSFSQYYSEVLKAFVFTCKSLPEMNTYNVWESINTDYALALAELVLRLIEENQLNKSKVKRILEDANQQ